MDYVELHNHTYYSPLDGLSSPEEYCARAKEVGIDHIAITDHGTVAGHRHFQRATTEAGITPILGVEAYISETTRFDKRAASKRDDGTDKYSHIILLAKNDQGVQDINKLSEIGWTEGFYSKPRIDFDILSELGDNLVILSGCMGGLISKAFREGNIEEAERWTRRFKDRFDDDFYMEIQTHNDIVLNNQLLDMADKYQIKPVLTGDCHFADPADKWAEEAFLILGTKAQPIKDRDMTHANKLDLLDRLDYLYPDRKMRFTDIDLFLESSKNLHKQLVDKGIERTDVFSNTVEIANKVETYEYKTNQYTLPAPDKDIRGIFTKIIEQGMRKRGLHNKPEYVARIKEEIAVIQEKDIEVYFVILADVLKFCRDEQIAIGAGRGSAAGSLVCYAMEITEVDPIEHKLLFWRFLDPERDDMPDIDIDVQDTRRAEVKRYLERKYGKDRVASVTNYGMYKGKSAIKAACRVLAIDYKLSNKVAKELTDFVGDDDAAEKNMAEYLQKESLKEFREANPDVYKIASKIAGRLNQYGMHAGGVVITEKPLTDWVGVESRAVEGEDFRQSVIAINGDQAAELGLVKYDFLGLKNLSVVADAIQFIKKNHGVMIDFKKLKEDDSKVFKMITEGRTLGVFQATADASTDVIKKMGIENFNDLVASNALVRPGAWKAFGDEYIARKKGFKKVTYPTKQSEEFLNETYGFYLYQEQTMQICTMVAGMSKGDANKIRKLTAKKKSKTELQPYKKKFFEGALKNVGQASAEKLWADIELTAEYSFNKCLAEDTEIHVRIDDMEYDEPFLHTMKISELAEQYKIDGGNVLFSVKGPEWIKDNEIGPDTWHPIKDIHDNGVQPTVRIWTDSETGIESTFMHKHRLSNRWKEAYDIHQNDKIWTDQGKTSVAGRRFAGMQQTYDLELFDEPHAFYANGFLTHNSHAVAYSKLSYVTAWLKYHYPAEFMTALLANEDTAKKDNHLSDYLVECSRMNINVNRPDINKSEIHYSTTGGQIYMGLSNIKGIGEKSAEKIMAQRPYTSYEDLLEKVAEKGNGVTNAHLKSLDAIAAYDFADKPVDQDKIAENFYEFLGIPSMTSGLSVDMESRLHKVSEFDDEKVMLMACIVKSIEEKGWVKVSVIDSSGSASFFADKDHGLIKGHQYIMLVAKNSLIDAEDLSTYRTAHPLLKYLRGEMDEGNWVVGAKVRTTKNNKKLGTLVFTHKGKLQSCLIFSNKLENARMYCRRGSRVRLAVDATKDGTLYLEGAAAYEQ